MATGAFLPFEDFTTFKSFKSLQIIVPTITKSCDFLQEQILLNRAQF